MRVLAGSLALALALYAATVQAQNDTDQSQQQPVQGTIESVHLDAHPRLMGTTCNPTRVQFSGRIKTNGPAFVTYRWLRSDRTHKDGELQESAAGGKTVSTSWDQTSTAKGWVQLIVLTPKHVETPKSYFWVHCGTS
ncbi:MAG TPA: hypothetical protein VJN67_05460 [Stellaceae bacterium]|nr:hypothetical protein [Stellaceae bacterium]